MNLVNDILIAEKRIKNHINHTAFDYSMKLSQITGAQVYLKCEHQQRTGSFKFRGAMNKILSLNSEQLSKGVIAASTGNHGQGVALAGKICNSPVTVYVPQTASKLKVDAIKSWGAQILTVDGDCLAAEIIARDKANKTGMTFISPYNDQEVMAGQGTIGIEIAQQCQDLDVLFCVVGGGGLIGGIASYLKHVNPKIKIIACCPQNAPAMYECVKAGKIIDVPELPTISDATAGGVEPGSITFEYCRDLIDDYVLVSEDEIANAMKTLAQTDSWMVEGAAATTVAGLLKVGEQYKNKKVVVVLSGRNIALDKFLDIVK